jgi:hypothetical protein
MKTWFKSEGKPPSLIRKIVINTCYGEFGLSAEGEALYKKLTRKLPLNVVRDCPSLVYVVEMLGKKANGPFASLKVVEIPAYVKWEIVNYDGYEQISELTRRWS